MQQAKENFAQFIAPVNQILQSNRKTLITKGEWELMQDLLEFSMSACLDVLSTEQDRFTQGETLKRSLYDWQRNILRDQGDPSWGNYWKKELAPTEENDQIMRKIIDSDRLENFLDALYDAVNRRKIAFLGSKLKEQFRLAKTDQSKFLTSLNEILLERGQNKVFSGLLDRNSGPVGGIYR